MATPTIDNWLGGTGDWDAAGNWSQGEPGTADVASFGDAQGISVALTAAATIGELLDAANSGATLVVDEGTLALLDGGTWDGVFVLAPFSELVVTGAPLLLSGIAALDGAIAGPGTVAVGGSAELQALTLTGSAVLLASGVIGADGALTLGTASADAAELRVAAGGTFDLLGDFSIQASGSAGIVNAGLFEKSGAGGTSFIGAVVANSGTIAVDRGTLGLDAGSDLLGGTILGGGELDLRGGAGYTLASGLSLGVATLGVLDNATEVTLDASLAYAGLFTLGNLTDLDLNGAAFTLGGSSDALLGTIAGAGTLEMQGAAEANLLLLTSGAELDDSGVIGQDGLVDLGTGGADSATLSIASGATYDLLGNVSLNGYGSAAIDNGGTFEKTGAAGTSIVRGSLASSGAIVVDAGTLSVFGPAASFSGTLAGAGELDLRGGGQYTLGAGVAVSVATLGILDLGTSLSIADTLADAGGLTLGTGATLALGGANAALSGISWLDGVMDGPGTASVSGSADVNGLTLAGSAELDDQSVITEDGPLALGSAAGDAAVLTIEAGDTYDMVSDDPIVGSTSASITNVGLWEKTGVSGISSIDVVVVDSGTIAVGRGTLDFMAGLTNEGLLTIGGAGAQAGMIVAALADDAGSIALGTGGTLMLQSGVPAETIGFSGGPALLQLGDPGNAAGTISGFGTGDTIDLAGIAANGLTYANGLLVITETSNGTLATVATLQLPGIADPSQLAVVPDGSGGTAIEFAPAGDPPGSLAPDAWIGAGGDWSDPANWSSAVPGIGEEAIIAPVGTAGFTVGYTVTDTVGELNGGEVSAGAAITLAIGGGALTVDQGGEWSGAIVETAGTFDATAGFAIGGTLVLGSTALGEVDSGTLSIANGTVAGTLTGAGELRLTPGQVTIAPGASLAIASLDLDAGGGAAASVTLDSSLGYDGDFVLEGAGLSGAALLLNGNSIGLAGTAALDGAIAGAGTVGLAGVADIDALVLSGSALLDDGGTIAQDGSLTLGDAASDASTLQVDAGAVYDVLADTTIAASAAAVIVNAGLFEKTGSNGSSTIAASFTSTGTLEVASGTLSLGGGNISLGGGVGGAGTLQLGAGGNATLAASVSLAVGALAIGAIGGAADTTTLAADLTYSGGFLLAGSGMLDLAGYSLDVSGSAQLDGAIEGGGTLGTIVLSGSADIGGLTLAGAVDFADTGTVSQDGTFTLGNSGSYAPLIQIAAAATYDILADVGIAGGASAAIANAGLLEKSGAFGTSTIIGNLVDSGTILAASGTLVFAGGTADSLAGTVSGAGEIDLEASGSATLQSGLALAVAGLGVYGGDIVLGGAADYAGDFALGSGATLTPNGYTLVLSGAASLGLGMLNGGLLTIGGTGDVDGFTVAGGGTLDDAGVLSQDGMLTLGTAAADSAGLVIAAGATYDILTDDDINSEGDAAISNSGLLEKTGLIGDSYLFANVTNTGTIAVTEGSLTLLAGIGNLGGRITGAGELDLDSAGTYTLAADLTLDVAALGLYGGADIVLGGSRSFAGYATLGAGTTLSLGGRQLTLPGTLALGGIIAGPGSVAVQGSADANGLVLSGAAVLNDSGIITEDGAVTLGAGATDSAQLDIAAGGTYDFTADVDLDASAGASVVENAGVFEKTLGSGASTVQGAADNTGTIAVASGTLAFSGSLTNDRLLAVTAGELVAEQALGADAGLGGTIGIGGGEAMLEGAVSSAETIAFTGAGVLALAQPTQIGGTITGFRSRDTIDLTGASFTPGADVVSFAGQVLTITNGGTTIASLDLAGSYSAGSFQLADDGAHGTAVTIPCFVAGTRIATARGEVPIEQLAEGELVLTCSGEARPIVWIGRRRIACDRHAEPHKVRPVRIRAAAFGPGLPRRDLLLSPDHAVFADGVLVPVKHLLNGVSIRQENISGVVAYLHIELASHEVVLAEGLPVETYLDSGNRAEFAEGTDVTLPARAAVGAEQLRCAPLCTAGARLANVKRRLLSRVEREGWTTTAVIDLHLVAGGRTIRAANVRSGVYRFALPAGAEQVRIVSPSGIPAELDAESEDGRRLGVAIEAIAVDRRRIPLDDAALGAGFYGLERRDDLVWRWTDGDAALSFAATEGQPTRVLELRVRAAARRWLAPLSEPVCAA